MIVVADASPIHYLVLIDAADLLHRLYERVLVPEAVAEELKQVAAPEPVRAWMAQPPQWCEIRSDPPSDPAVDPLLDPGERAAITLALSVSAERLLIDDWEGRVAAVRHRLLVTGTLGILAEAHRARVLDFEAALARLSQTNFYLSQELLDHLRQRLSDEI